MYFLLFHEGVECNQIFGEFRYSVVYFFFHDVGRMILIAFLPIFFQVTPPTRRKSSSVLVGNQRVSDMIVTPSYDTGSPDTLQMPLVTPSYDTGSPDTLQMPLVTPSYDTGSPDTLQMPLVTPSYDTGSPDTLQMPLPPKEQEKKKSSIQC